jgi:hypothetical protein
MARADPNHIGYNHTRQTASTCSRSSPPQMLRRVQADAAAELLHHLKSATDSLLRFQQLAFPPDILASNLPGPSPPQPANASPWSTPGLSPRPLRNPATTAEVLSRHTHSEHGGHSGSIYGSSALPLRTSSNWQLPLPTGGTLPPPSSERAQQQRAPLPSLTGPGAVPRSASLMSSSASRDTLNISSLVHTGAPASSSSSFGPSPYSIDPSAGPSRLGPTTMSGHGQRSLPYPLTTSSSQRSTSGPHESDNYSRQSGASDSDSSHGSQDDSQEEEMAEVEHTEPIPIDAPPHVEELPSTSRPPSREDPSI